jgi:hypothetical protein
MPPTALTEAPKSKQKAAEKMKSSVRPAARKDFGPTSAGDVALQRFLRMPEEEGRRHDRALQKIGAKSGTGGP